MGREFQHPPHLPGPPIGARVVDRDLDLHVAEVRAAVALDDVRLLGLRSATAVDLLEHLEQLADERYVSPYHLAIVHFGLGDVEATCKALRKAEEDRDPMLANLSVDPRLSELRQRPDVVASVAP